MEHTFKSRMQSGERLLGTMVTTFASVDLPKVLAVCGFDFIVIDCEHGSFTTRETADMIASARAIGLPAMIRIPELRREHVLKGMEMGATGLLLPNTETAEQARTLVDWAKYAGHRGVSLSRPHTDFVKVEGRSYMDRANAEGVIMVQIESRRGVENIEEIMAVEGVDMALIGPNDMSQDYGLLGRFDHPELEAAFARTVAAARSQGRQAGAHFGSSGPLKPWLERGMTVTCGTATWACCRQAPEAWRSCADSAARSLPRRRGQFNQNRS